MLTLDTSISVQQEPRINAQAAVLSETFNIPQGDEISANWLTFINPADAIQLHTLT